MDPEDPLFAQQQQQFAPPPAPGAALPQSQPIMPAAAAAPQQAGMGVAQQQANPNPNAMGNIFDTYEPKGAMGGLFAPAYIRGFGASEDAVQGWMKDRRLPSNQIDQTAMPGVWHDPRIAGKSPYKGGQIPLSSNLTGRGAVDPEALRAASMGGFTYDMDARRAAIATRVAENAAAQKAVGWDPNDPATWVPFNTKKKKT